jgi:hypothetical protein
MTSIGLFKGGTEYARSGIGLAQVNIMKDMAVVLLQHRNNRCKYMR